MRSGFESRQTHLYCPFAASILPKYALPPCHRREQEKAERRERAAAYQAASWAADGSNGSDDAADALPPEEQLVYYCAACEKHFKSEASFANHER